MDPRINRFKLCDLRFHSHLTRVIERLPEPVREAVLRDTGFQILTDEDAPTACVLRYRFKEPVNTLVYLNTNLLKAPEHQLLYTIAAEIAHYILSKNSGDSAARDPNTLLQQWGFDQEVAAAHSSGMVCESRGYKIGYEWAKMQDRDYLQQHFGIYYDAWNRKGLQPPAGEKREADRQETEPVPLLRKIIRVKQEETADSCPDKFSETPSLRQEVLAGIMAAMKASES